jgi:LAO/AO transport system kinase
MAPEELFRKLRAGDRAALGRAITLVESTRQLDREHARQLVELAAHAAAPGVRMGITGIPGVGKSSLIDTLGMELLARGHRVAVLAVDPSSARSGGSILGDKTRMERLSHHPDAFIRPSPTGGTLGGVARRTRETILLCEASGYDRILVETVGVGQSELEVDQLSDLNVLLMIAGAGDELQGIKRGIMESADLVVFTKVDGENAARARLAAAEWGQALALLPARASGRSPEILLTSATTGQGVAELVERLETLAHEERESGRLDHRRRQQDLHWLEQMIDEGLRERFAAMPGMTAMRKALEDDVLAGRREAAGAAAELLDRFLPRP